MVTIIIPSSNGKHLLRDCLPAVMALRMVEFEVLVVDNGSTDGTVEFLMREFPGVRVIEVEEALGFSKAVNIGIRASHHAYVALLNNDTQVEPEWLYELVDALERHPEVGFCASKILKDSERHLIYSAGDGFTVAGFAYGRGKEDPEAIYYLEEEYVFGACAGAALYRREVFDDVGLFDEDFYAFFEDVDLSYRAQMRGYRCLFVPSARVYHIGGATFGNIAERSLYYGNRNRVFFLAKNLPRRVILRRVPSMLAYMLINVIMYTIKGQAGPVIRGHIDGFRHLGGFLAKREANLALQTVEPSYLESITDRHWVLIMLRLSRFLKRFYQPLHPPQSTREVVAGETLALRK